MCVSLYSWLVCVFVFIHLCECVLTRVCEFSERRNLQNEQLFECPCFFICVVISHNPYGPGSPLNREHSGTGRERNLR